MALPGYDPHRDAGACVFNEEKAERVVRFFELCLTHVKGKRFALEPFLLERWQVGIIANLFGWYRPDGTRRYREVFCYVPRKNGKSLLAAGAADAVLFQDGEPGAEIYSAAGDEEQATIVFDMAKQMILQDDVLSSSAEVFTKAITYKGGTFQPVTSKAKTKHGFNAHMIVIDELHAHDSPELIDVLETSMGTRTDPITFCITTADYERPNSVCNEKHDYAKKVRDGDVDDPYFLPAIWETDKEADWTAPEVWAEANPNLGVSVSLEYLQEKCNRAQSIPRFENEFKRLHLNMRTEQDERFLPIELWDACGEPIDIEALEGRDCVCGMDLSATTDISAIVLVFKDEGDTGIGYTLLPFLYIPKRAAAARAVRDKVRYKEWLASGLLLETVGSEDVVDHQYLVAQVVELSKRFKIREVALDPANATAVASMLESENIERVMFGQSFLYMNAPTKELERLIISEKLRHGGHPVLRWMAKNLAVDTDHSGRLRPSKKKSFEKIDGMVAAIMAIGRWMAGPCSAESVYERRGFLEM